MNPISVFRPSIGEEEVQAVREVLLSGWLGLGPKTKEFEDKFSEFLGPHQVTQAQPFSVGVNSCTAALDLAVRLLDIKYGDEVIVPTMTFISTAHVVSYAHATPVFCDINENTLLMDIDDALERISPRTKAIIPVHYGGRMADIFRLRKELSYDEISIIEDCAHACGSSLNNWSAGTLGDLACFSFQAVKNLATGDGGMLVTPDEKEAEHAKKLRWLGIDKGTWDRKKDDKSYWWDYSVEEVGLKCHMNDINAAIGIVQLSKLKTMNNRRRKIVQYYRDQLCDLDVQLPVADNRERQSSWHIFQLQTEKRDDLVVFLRDRNIATGVHYKPLHLYGCYGNKPSLPVAERVWKRLITLPLYPDMTDSDVERVVKEVREFYGR